MGATESDELDDALRVGWGGHGGASAWGGGRGGDGDYGASNGGDSTDTSKKYAKSGGWDGLCAEPSVVPFYIYKKPDATSGPQVTCTTGHGVTRSGIEGPFWSCQLTDSKQSNSSSSYVIASNDIL